MPAYQNADDLRSEGASIDAPVWVISLALFRDARRSEILLGVRRDTPTTRRHPGVLSTLTMRIPASFFRLLVDGDLMLSMERGDVVLIDGERRFPLGSSGFYETPAAFVLESLLAKKLQLGELLFNGGFRADAALRGVALDQVADPLGTDEDEWTAMATFEAVILKGAEEIPGGTAAYSRLIWAPVALVEHAFVAGDALIVDESLDPFEVCIGGLCIRSVVRVING